MADAGDPAAVWAELDAPWRAAFEQAWIAWCTGNFGIGAALVDPAGGDIVSLGRNRVGQREPEPGLLSGTFMAHAEMNAYAAMGRELATGLHLYTTLQPCLMCAATTIQMNVAQVHYAARDEFFDGLDGLWRHHHYSRDREPNWVGPIGGRLERFARLLPMSFMMLWIPHGAAADVARAADPDLASLALHLPHDHGLVELKAERAGPVDALTQLWDRLGGHA